MPRLTKAQREERLSVLRAEASQLESLQNEPGWDLLAQASVERQRKDFQQLTRPVEVPVRKFDYDRGFAAGMEYLLSIPAKAQETLRQAERSVRAIQPELEG